MLINKILQYVIFLFKKYKNILPQICRSTILYIDQKQYFLDYQLQLFNFFCCNQSLIHVYLAQNYIYLKRQNLMQLINEVIIQQKPFYFKKVIIKFTSTSKRKKQCRRKQHIFLIQKIDSEQFTYTDLQISLRENQITDQRILPMSFALAQCKNLQYLILDLFQFICIQYLNIQHIKSTFLGLIYQSIYLLIG
ncbi:hypothetical protein TTHERM_001402800 (macronuclear) [Tetrahymena thermophila SB210]|uniref:Uncharacterized protein n=1 Tax=Tetrahymena thermophila (strain SB210) TaxID=312017 RepID=W7X3U9_TETTS|nr:hypothetical protein TTHERM_001402800 [Tetrahymena thermophila SB210]EWS71098.1 hypothetical protein TTHERM_001402800 [Tetrahymena thermophila SB210]|eukprot:XP_012656365.1 hypothetical protein TTHERM_001402800 [Tetrahymena thermophila SB210]